MATTFDEVMQQLAGTTGRGVLETKRLYDAGLLTERGLRGALQELLEVAAVQGANYGQLTFAQIIEVFTDIPKATVVVPEITRANNHKTIIARSLDTVLGGDAETLTERLAALGRNLPVQAMQRGYSDALRDDNRVAGWVRGLEADSCELCVWWWDNGRLYAQDHEMPTHPGCMCQQIPEVGNVEPRPTREQVREQQRRDKEAELAALDPEERARRERQQEHIKNYYIQKRAKANE